MPQILKDGLRQALLSSATEEFLNNGYENASMRNIARKADMTVGNIYRYFDSKEDIHRHIVAETLDEINNLLKTLTSNSVSMETRVFTLKANIDDLKDLMNKFSERLVEIYVNHSDEFNILMMHSELSEELTNWFSIAIRSLIEQHYLIPGYKTDRDILSHAYASSIFTGIKEIFKNTSYDDKDILIRIVKTYLNSYVVMLDNDIKRVSV